MAKGLVKAKEYDWKDSNLALFGSDVEKNVNNLIVLFTDTCLTKVVVFFYFLDKKGVCFG